jgi:DNA-binding transcriptional LysR family regulator
MATRLNLDLDTLRTLVVAHDLGGLAQAADRLGRTPSAISLQMKRLQDDLGTVLFRKRGRGLMLTEVGEVALTYARRILGMHDELLDTIEGGRLAGNIRIGCPQDFAIFLPSVLSQFARLYPRMQVELLIEGNAALAEAIERSQIDLAVVIGHEHRPAAQTVGQLDLVWIASSTFVPPQGQPLPLAVLGPQCAFRRCAIQHLDAIGMPYRIAAVSPSLEGLQAALLGGLGITTRTSLSLSEGLIFAESLFGLPLLGSLPVSLHRSAHLSGEAADCMATLLVEALRFVLASRSSSEIPHKRHNGLAVVAAADVAMHKPRSRVR